MGSAGEKGKAKRDRREEITRRGQRGCWVIKEIKRRGKGRDQLLCISHRTTAGTRPLVGSSPHSNTHVPLEREPITPAKIPFSSTSDMTAVTTLLPSHPIITLRNQSPEISLLIESFFISFKKSLVWGGGVATERAD